MILDVDSLRRDLISYFESAFYSGGYGAAIIDISKVERASITELIQIANNNNFNLFDYIIENNRDFRR